MVKKKKTPVSGESLQDLADLARKLGMPDGHLDGELRDAADDEADLIYENMKSSTIFEQLEFLYLHGYQLGRLKEIIEEGRIAEQ